MTTNHILIACWVCLGGALLGYAQYVFASGRRLAEMRKETSRFRLFAARDRLVRLVIDGRVSADEEAWRRLYSSVNNLLGLDKQLHLVDVTLRYMKFSLERARNPMLAAESDRCKRAEDKLARKVPAFEKVRSEVDTALLHLVWCRTTKVHVATILTMIVLLRAAAVALSDGPKLAKAAFDTAIKPSPDGLKGWGMKESSGLRLAA